MAPTAIAPASGSRSEPRPVLKTTKEWQIPPRPKPGRRPRSQVQAEQAAAAAAAAAMAPSPQSSNVKTRKASASYIRGTKEFAALESKILVLEQQESQRCIMYQQQAARAMQEVQQLRDDKTQLEAIIHQLRVELDQARGDQHRFPQTLPADMQDDNDAADSGRSTKRRRTTQTRGSTTNSLTAEDFGSPYMNSIAPLSPNSSSAAVSPPHENPQLHTHPAPSSGSTCGFCSSAESCFCASVGVDVAFPSQQSATPLRTTIKLEDELELDGPLFQPAVPLRLRSKASSSRNRPVIWALEAPAKATTSVQSAPKPALCNGDPSNCPACSDDPFGKAFCESLSQSVCSNQPCATCPSAQHHANASANNKRIPTPPPEIGSLSAAAAAARAEAETEALFDQLTDLPCCGDPAACGSLTCGPPKGVATETTGTSEMSTTAEVEMLPKSVPSGIRTMADKIPCNEAWTTLKNHPNIAFADLQMLADVVARRTRCDGPVPVVVTAPSTSPEPASTAGAHGAGQVHASTSTSPRQDTLAVPGLLCGSDAVPSQQRRRLTVEREAVNEALQILDLAGRGKLGMSGASPTK